MSAETCPPADRRTDIQHLDGFDLESQLRHIAVNLVGNMVRFSRRTNGSTVTAAVAGSTFADAEVSLLIDTIVTDNGKALPTDSELPWNELATSDVLAHGTVTDDKRHLLTAIVNPAMLCTSVTVTFRDGRQDLTDRTLAGYATELPCDVTLFFRLDRRHGSEVASKFAVVCWFEIATSINTSDRSAGEPLGELASTHTTQVATLCCVLGTDRLDLAQQSARIGGGAVRSTFAQLRRADVELRYTSSEFSEPILTVVRRLDALSRSAEAEER